MKKIVFYISSLERGGAERVFVNLAHDMYEHGYRVAVVTQYQGENEYELNEQIPRLLSDLTDDELHAGRIANFVARLKKLRKIFKEQSADLIMTCNGKSNMMALAASLGLHCRVVLSVIADPMMEYYTKAMRLIARTFFVMADGIVVQTEEVKNFFPPCIRKKCKRLPNSLNPAFVRNRYEGSRKKEIVSVGRLDENKNQEMLIRAFEKIEKQFPEYNLILYGEGEMRDRLEKLVKEFGLEEKVFLPGKVTNVADAINAVEIFVLTSYTEGMPNALLEAMALGLAVISTDCPSGGPRSLICDGDNGRLIPPGDTKALEEALFALLENDEYRNTLGANAMKIQENLCPDKVNQMWREYFQNIMDGKGK